MRRRVGFAAIVAVIALGALAWWPRGTGPGPRSGAGSAPPSTDERAAATGTDAAPVVSAGGADAPSLAAKGAPASGAGRRSLEGRVTDAGTGRAAAGARVTAIRTVEGGPARAETAADADGRYAFEGLRPGPWRAFAQAPGKATRGLGASRRGGYDPLAVDLAPDATATLDLVLVPGAVASGRVFDADGTPFAGATVAAVSPAWDSIFSGRRPAWTATETAVTAADGSYRLDAIAPGGEVRIEATSPERLDARAGPFRAAEGAAIAADLRFAAVRFVDVRVVDAETGAPVPRARVIGWWASGPTSWKGFDEAWTADDAGRLRAGPFPAGPVKVTAHREGWVLGQSVHLVEPIPPEQAEVVLGVSSGAGAAIEIGPHPRTEAEMRWPVRVVGPDGAPVPRGWVRAYEGSSGGGSGIEDGLADLRLREAAPERWAEAFDARTADDAPLPFAPVRVKGITERSATLRMVPERTIEGRVLAPDGAGVVGVLVVAFPDWWRGQRRIPSFDGHSSARTDASGAFRIGRLADTEYDLEVRSPASYSRGGEVTARAGATGVVIRLFPAVTATVTVRDDLGAPLAGAQVRAGLKGALERTAARVDEEVVSRTTDADGTARFDDLDPSRLYELAVDPPLSRPELEPKPPAIWHADDLVVALARIWEIRGVVRSPSGERVEGATLSVVEESPPGPPEPPGAPRIVSMRSVPVAPDGSFVLRRDSPEAVRLEAGIEGGPLFGPRREAVLVRPGAPEVTLTVDPGLVLEVQVEGSPEGGGRSGLSLEPEDPSDRRRWVGSRLVGAAARFRGLAPGATYSLLVRYEHHDLVAFERGVRGGDGVRKLRLRPGLHLSGTVSLPPGVASARIEVSQPGLRVSRGVGPDGSFDIGALAEGTYSLVATAVSGGAQVRAEAKAPAGTTGIELVLR